mgnify:CR=1 FL=1
MKTIAYQKFTAITVAPLFLFAFTGCKKDDPPPANFTYQVAELSVSFTYAGTDAESYSWDFGDGNSSTVQNPSHTYGAGGTYTVVLTATKGDGDDEESQDVLVEASALLIIQIVKKKERLSKSAPRKPTGICNFI